MPVLVFHAGAGGEARPARQALIKRELARIGDACWPMLRDGASAVDVVVEVTRMLEDVPEFNAGVGSKLQADGRARLSAALMCGETERFAGVVNLEGFPNPILACPSLLDARDRVLAGDGASRWAEERGLSRGRVVTEERLAEHRAAAEGKSGTVGAVALDYGGRIAAAISTGGRGHEHVGRVSDSPTVAGHYATASAAATMTGIGEQIVDGALAARLVCAVESGNSLREASDAVLARIESRAWEVGFVAVDATGAWVAETSVWMGWRAYDDAGTYGTP